MPNQKNIDSVKSLTDKLSRANSIFFTDYLGLDVLELTLLRKKFFEQKIEYLVVKNTLLKIASKECKISLNDNVFYGSTAIALSYDEPVLPAKVIKSFLKERELPALKGILFEGAFLDAADFDKIANLPSKDESLRKILFMLNSPIRNFASLLNSPMVGLLNVLNSLKQNKS